MITNILFFIAALLTFLILFWIIPFGNILAVCFAIIATLIFIVVRALTKATMRHINRQRQIDHETNHIMHEQSRRNNFQNLTNETEAQRKARVNAEVDKIIEEQRNNKKQS